jgi:hypothetical protein
MPKHNCSNCGWFDYNVQRFGTLEKARAHGNRECLYPGKLEGKAGTCAMWKDGRTFVQRLKGEKIMKGIVGAVVVIE